MRRRSESDGRPGKCPIDDEIQTIVLKTLAKERDRRYQSPGAIADDLRRYLAGDPIDAKRDSGWYLLRKSLRRHKAPLVGGLALIVIGISLGFTIAFRYREAIEQLGEKTSALVTKTAALVTVESHVENLEAEIDRKTTLEALLERGRRLHAATVNDPEERIFEAAEDVFRKVLEIDPDHELTLIAWATMKKDYFNSEFGGDTAVLREADEFYRRARKLSPEGRKALNPHGVVLKMLGQYDDAIEAYQESLAKIPEEGIGGTHHYSTVSNLGTVYALAKDLRNAEDQLRKGAEIAGSGESIYRAPSWRNLAALELFLDQSQALEDVNHALDCNASDVASWILKARIELELGEEALVEEALDDVKHADRSRNGKRRDAKRIRALAHLRFHQFNHAITQAELAMQLSDMRTINHLIIAIAEANLNHPTKARDSVVRAVETWPDDLRDPGAYRATAESGELWFDTHDELEALHREAESAISAMTPPD
ncbi:MAG: tetratricopeptide repeat protein [Planctomycetes bacterium]|nr:tetratricopeptide repeat protein [Planctomycetota bacterium]